MNLGRTRAEIGMNDGLPLGSAGRAEESVHGAEHFIRCAVRARAVLSIVDINADFSPRSCELGFTVGRQILPVSTLLGVAGEEAAEQASSRARGRRESGSGGGYGVVCRRCTFRFTGSLQNLNGNIR